MTRPTRTTPAQAEVRGGGESLDPLAGVGNAGCALVCRATGEGGHIKLALLEVSIGTVAVMAPVDWSTLTFQPPPVTFH